MKAFLKMVIGFSLVLSQKAYSCGGVETKYKVNFKHETADEGLIVILTDPKNAVDTKIVSDDTGFISAYLGALFLYKSEAKDVLRGSDGNVIFIKNQMTRFEAVLNDYLKPHEKDAMWPAMNGLLNYLEGRVVDRFELFHKILEVQNKLTQLKVNVKGRMKSSMDESWSREMPMGELKLPDHHVYRGGCNSSIGEFSSAIGMETNSSKTRNSNLSDEDSLPSFDFSTR